MKKNLPLLFFFFLVVGCLKSLASHILGAEISYFQVSANTYQVTYRNFRDCAGAQVAASATIQVQAPGCNTGRNIVLNQVSKKLIRSYGPALPVTCTTTGRPTVEIVTYSGLLTFTAAQAACPDWVLSWSECCRNNTANLVGQENVYTETKLKLLNGVVNSSPAFDTLHAPTMLVNVGMEYTWSMAATDPDGDSLVYSAVVPLKSANTPITYKPFPGVSSTPGLPAGLILNPDPQAPYYNPGNPQFAQFASGAAPVYGPNLPIPTLSVNWTGPPTINYGPPFGMIWEAKQEFFLNPNNGELRFRPARYIATGTPSDNKYVVSVLVEEYRKINGVMTKLGSVRRETIIDVTETTNRNPTIVTRQFNTHHILPGSEIRVRPGVPLKLELGIVDPDSNSVAVTTNASYILPGSTFNATSGSTPTGTLTWTPTAAHVRWQPYFFQVMLRDDENPLRGVRIETFMVRVSNTGTVTGTGDDLTVSNFTAYPNPFSEELNFNLNLQTKAESILIYNLLGQKVDEISLKMVGLGEQKVQWQSAGKYAAGTYVARLISEDKNVQTLKFIKLQ